MDTMFYWILCIVILFGFDLLFKRVKSKQKDALSPEEVKRRKILIFLFAFFIMIVVWLVVFLVFKR